MTTENKPKTKSHFGYAKQELFVAAADFLSENESDIEAWTNFKSSELRQALTERLHAKFIEAMMHGIDVGATMVRELDDAE